MKDFKNNDNQIEGEKASVARLLPLSPHTIIIVIMTILSILINLQNALYLNLSPMALGDHLEQ